jgi:hypothetical protein
MTNSNLNNRHICPVCGYPNLEEPPYDQYGCPSSEICPCCGTEFGYDDANISHNELRNKWIIKGMKWYVKEKQPEGWDVNVQLKALEIKLDNLN